MKDLKIYLSIASILLIVFLVAEYNKPNQINWDPTLYYNHKIPFGTYITYNQLNQLFPGAKVVKTNSSIYHTFHNPAFVPGSYLIISKEADINRTDFGELVKYLKAGNSVFISSFNFKGFLADTLKIRIGYEYKKGNANLVFANSKLKQIVYKFDRDVSNQYFSDFDTAKATVIGKNVYDHSTFLNFKFGKGNLLLCANPGIFTNYSLLLNNGSAYAAKTLSYLPVTKVVYWDEFQNGDIPADQSPLRVFFGNPNLQWAYYISLFGLIIYVLYEIKRRQRIIPIIKPLTNSTLEFVTTVGQVYYEKRNNTNIAHKKILYLLTYLRDEYYIKTNNIDQEFIETLVAKLGVEQVLATELVSKIHQLDQIPYVSDRELIALNQLIEKFYTQARQ